jgi:hypothetical protein
VFFASKVVATTEMENYYKLRSWIPLGKLNRFCISMNKSPGLIKFVRENPDVKMYRSFMENPIAVEMSHAKFDIVDIPLLRKHSLYLNRHHYVLQYVIENINSPDLKQNLRSICSSLSTNPAPEAIAFLRENPEHICWDYFCENSSDAAIALLREHPDKINVFYLAHNKSTAAMKLMEEIYIDWLENDGAVFSTAANTSGSSVSVVSVNGRGVLDEGDWEYIWEDLCRHPAGWALVKKHKKPINWERLSSNPAPDAIELLSKNLDKVNWTNLSCNPGAIDILKQVFYAFYDADGEKIKKRGNETRFDIEPHIDWYCFSQNSAIFEYDYYTIRKMREELHRDLYEWYWSPRRVEAFLDAGGDIDDLSGDF